MSDAIQQAIDALKQAEVHCREQHLYLMGNMQHNAIRALEALQHRGQVGIYSSACQQDYVEWTDDDDKKYRIHHATPHSMVPKGYVLVHEAADRIVEQEALQHSGEAVYIRIIDDENAICSAETEAGERVAVPEKMDGAYILLGPFYTTPQPVPDVDAKREAESLAMSLWQKWYKDDSPNFELCDSVAGVITQINNMTAGLVREDVSWGVDWGRSGDRSCVSICKSFPDGSLEIVATEFSPYTAPQPMVPEGWKIHKKDSAFTLTHPDGTELKFGYSNGGIMTHMLIELCEALLSAGKGGEV